MDASQAAKREQNQQIIPALLSTKALQEAFQTRIEQEFDMYSEKTTSIQFALLLPKRLREPNCTPPHRINAV